MTVVERIKRTLDRRLLVSRCQDGNCSVALGRDAGKFALVHVDVAGDPCWSLAASGEERCDYLFIGYAGASGHPWVVPLELTTYQDKPPDKIAGQLQTGARIADSLIAKESEVRFRPVLASLNLRRHIRVQLGRKWIEFRGKRARVVEIECGGRLTEVLRE